ncbi:MAG: hypothetical protein QOG67_2703 [Verrucomicrobiota bacterium]
MILSTRALLRRVLRMSYNPFPREMQNRRDSVAVTLNRASQLSDKEPSASLARAFGKEGLYAARFVVKPVEFVGAGSDAGTFLANCPLFF